MPVKEPLFFINEHIEELDRHYPTLERYCNLYRPAPREALVGDASPQYIRYESAIDEILRLRPDAKFIVAVRNPINMAQSLHYQMLLVDSEPSVPLEEVWEQRREKLLSLCGLHSQLLGLFRKAPEDQRLVVVLEDLARQPLEVYQRVLRFLGLPYDGRTAFNAKNPHKTFRNMTFEKLHRRLRDTAAPYQPALEPILSRIGLRPLGWLRRVNLKAARRPPMRPKFRALLLEEFDDQIQGLEELLGRPFRNAL